MIKKLTKFNDPDDGDKEKSISRDTFFVSCFGKLE